MITKDDLIAAVLGTLFALCLLGGILLQNADQKYDTEQAE